jgi:hypothetical protein
VFGSFNYFTKTAIIETESKGEEVLMELHQVYEFYAELEDFKPKIWRLFQVKKDITTAQLAYIVMTLFEMRASHLYAVEHERPYLTPSGRQSKKMELLARFDMPSEDEDWLDLCGKDATKSSLSKLNLAEPTRLTVWYDFGDNWRVNLWLKKVLDENEVDVKSLPLALSGEGYGIIEDCGGLWGLEELYEVLKDKKGERYENMCEWTGIKNFDTSAFDIEDMNFRLKKIPEIYKKIYENQSYPTQKFIDLIERNYLKNSK